MNPTAESAQRPTPIQPRTHQILLEDLVVEANIGFHPFEIGRTQRLLITIRVTIDIERWPASDDREYSWDYDLLRTGVLTMIKGRHFNLQETLAREIFDLLAARSGVTGLSIWLRKPDVYADAKSVGILLTSD